MKILTRKSRLAFTLVEVMMSMGCGSLLLAAVVTSGVALQRSFAAVEGYSIAEADQLRVLDYIAMDCRRATNATVVNNTLTLTLPSYYKADNTPEDPSFPTGVDTVQYGAGTVTIAYSQSGSNFVRSVTRSGTTTTTAIATNVATFTVNPQDLTSSVSCSITFSPRFTYLPGPGPISGTTVYSNTFFRNAVARQ
jgi:Tfp pilus assembly protein PilW